MDYLKEMLKHIGNEYASVVEDGIEAGDVDQFIDTGSYMFNALVSGSLYGGLPSNKIVAFAGETSTGKTYFVMGVVKKFLDDNPDGAVFYFESESAITKQMMVNRGIDPKRILLVPVTTVQEFRHQSIKILDKYIEDGRPRPMLMVLDSLGMLSTTKEVEDTAEGKETRDMTRAQVTKAAFRVLTLKLGRAKVPFLVTNHTYTSVGSMFPTQEMGGGAGLKYAASEIVYLSKKKEKEGTEVIGNVIHCKTFKSRLTKENKIVDVLLTYDRGLHKYYGILYLAEKHGLVKKVSNKYEFADGTKAFQKQIYKNPCKFFTEEFLQKLEPFANKEFMYGVKDETEDTTVHPTKGQKKN